MSKQEVEYKSIYTAIFSLNYFTQGVNISIFAVVVPIYLLAQLGVVESSDIAGLATIVSLPFVVKFLYGILSDKIVFKKIGRRKPWILSAIFVAGIIWIILPVFLTPQNAFQVFTISGILIFLGIAIADTAIDGFILDICPKNQLGRVQGFCWSTRSIGTIIGGPMIAAILIVIPIEFIFITLGILMILFSSMILYIQEILIELREISIVENLKSMFTKKKNWKVYIFSLFNAVVDTVIIVFLSLYILIQMGIVGAEGATLEFVEEQIYTSRDLYSNQAIISLIVGMGVIIGSVIGGYIADLISRRLSVYLSLIITTVALLLMIIPTDALIILLIFAFFIGSTVGWRNSGFSAVVGEYSKMYPEMDSTYFAISTSFVNVGSTLGLIITSALFGALSGLNTFTIFSIVFIFMAILSNIGVIPFYFMDPKDYEYKLAEKS
jgi:MFS family permease